MTTPFKKAGYSPEDVFEVIGDSGGTFHKGDLVVLDYDYGNSCPKFKSVDGDKSGFLYVATEVKLHTNTKESVQKKIKFPCAVSAEGLGAKQLDELHDFFLRQGAGDYYRFIDPPHIYVGVDWDNDTNYFDAPEYFSEENDINEVTIYTYQELMEVGAEEPKGDPSVSPCEDVEEVLTEEVHQAVDKSESPSVTVTEPSCGKVKMKVVGSFVLRRVGDVWEVEVKNGEAYFYE